MTFRVRQLPHNLLFFALGFVYLWLVVEPDLLYHCFGTILPAAPLFATGKAFLLDRSGTPGGGILYAAGLLSQGYYSPWLGAAIIVLAALGLAELFRRHLALVGVTRSAWLTSLPAVAIFLIYSRYKHPLAICLTIALGLALSLAFERLALRRHDACRRILPDRRLRF
jgi:energy-converting hydrogenase Eha subunit E